VAENGTGTSKPCSPGFFLCLGLSRGLLLARQETVKMVAARMGLVAGHEAQALEAEIKRGRERV